MQGRGIGFHGEPGVARGKGVLYRKDIMIFVIPIYI